MTESTDTRTLPKSMRHKRILDVAAENPEDSIDDIAAEVPSATSDLVERVLDEYGDPAAEDGASTDEQTAITGAGDFPPTDELDMTPQDNDQSSSNAAPPETVKNGGKPPAEAQSETSGTEPPIEESDSTSVSIPEQTDLSEKQRKTVEAIAANPDATQRELADELGVTAATISSRVGDIDGFEWSDRRSFVDRLLESETQSEDDIEVTQMATDDIENSLAQLTDRIDSIETTLEELATESNAGSAFDDPELVQKVVHACVESDSVSEDEELRIIAELWE